VTRKLSVSIKRLHCAAKSVELIQRTKKYQSIIEFLSNKDYLDDDLDVPFQE
jgi:hypothetical protein